mmetsp:Transcript_5520/g.16397  ORF Transcript_5520/g.16397 Transcript_5520/m.16397 type:complete len:240 (+) Transcript_5520:419-1138(+)
MLCLDDHPGAIGKHHARAAILPKGQADVPKLAVYDGWKNVGEAHLDRVLPHRFAAALARAAPDPGVVVQVLRTLVVRPDVELQRELVARRQNQQPPCIERELHTHGVGHHTEIVPLLISNAVLVQHLAQNSRPNVRKLDELCDLRCTKERAGLRARRSRCRPWLRGAFRTATHRPLPLGGPSHRIVAVSENPQRETLGARAVLGAVEQANLHSESVGDKDARVPGLVIDGGAGGLLPAL